MTLTGTLEDLFAQVERAQVTSVSLTEAAPPVPRRASPARDRPGR